MRNRTQLRAARGAAASRLILIAGDILINTPPARPLHTTPKRNRNVSSRARIGTQRKKGGDSSAASASNQIKLGTAADQSHAGAGAGARTRPRPRFPPAFYLLLRGTARATGVWCARSRTASMESAVDSASTASEVSGSSGGSPRVKAASPARALSPPQLLAPRLPLPPPGLGLLGSLQMMHHSPLELMAAAHHHGPPRYGSPPPISTSDPSANECKLVDYRGQKVAAFIIQGDTMLCLPQAFELFLKHLVGGLHTVYTKLKRLDIVPLVCNVEQVRILRGLGAIQPGVNRCKLLSCKDFDVLYRDCTTARYVLTTDITVKYECLCPSLVPLRPHYLILEIYLGSGHIGVFIYFIIYSFIIPWFSIGVLVNFGPWLEIFVWKGLFFVSTY